MVAATNKTKIDARLPDGLLAQAIRGIGTLPPDSPIRKRLKKHGFAANMNGVVAWLMQGERAEMLKDEYFGGY